MISTKIKHFESASYEKGFYVPSHNDILAIKARLDLPSFLISGKGKIRSAEGYEYLQFGHSVRVLEPCSGKVAQLALDAVYAMKNQFLLVLEMYEHALDTLLLSRPRIFNPEVLLDAKMVLNAPVVEPFHPFLTYELPVCNKTRYALSTE